jgi:ectoine hydroxylase-related dioxygenase (phytanoyl-CoA dioxygenase family)
LLLENSFDPALVKTLQENFMHGYAAMDREAVEKTCLKVGADRYMFTLRLQPPFMDPAIYAAPRVLPVVRELLGEDCVLQSIGAVCAYPGSETQHVHRDHPDLFTESAGLSAFLPPFALHVVLPLVDLNESTGTTALWEGSHRFKTQSEEQHYSKEELMRLEGAALPWPKMGDCYFMDFRLRHAGTANVSNLPRPILYLVYSRLWFQDRKNFDIQTPLLISREEYERIPREFLPLFKNAKPQD